MSVSMWPTVHLRRTQFTVKRRFVFDRSALVVGEAIKHGGLRDPMDPKEQEWELSVTVNDSPWTNDNDAWVFFKLQPQKDYVETRAEATFTLEEIHDSRPKVIHKEQYPLRLMRRGGFEKVFPDGIPIRPTLQKLIISLHILYVGTELLTEKVNQQKKLPDTFSPEMGKKLQDMFDSGRHSDVVFVVGGVEIPAHRQILAAFSNVFAAMFEHDTKEQLTGRVVISDCKEQAFREMLRCLYSGSEPRWTTDDFTLDLLFVADKYCLQHLKSQCVDRMISTLNVNNVVALLESSSLLNLDSARDICLLFFKDAMKQILSTKSWEEMEKSNPQLAAKILRAVCTK